MPLPPDKEHLSPHFMKSELACKHCGQCHIEQSLLNALEQFRQLVGAPVIVDSGYRCPQHNKQIRGQPDSQHLSGRAADIRVEGKTARELYDIAVKIPAIRGIGVDDYRDYIHIDTRTVLHAPAKWCYLHDRLPGPWHEGPAPRPA